MTTPSVMNGSVSPALLVVLHSVVESGSVAGAAQRLHVTPSAVSNALGKLRQQLNDPLFVRSGRGITPTPRALELSPVIGAALGQVDAVLSSGAVPEHTTRRFRLACADHVQWFAIPSLVRALRRAMPLSSLDVMGIDSFAASGGLGGTSVDLVIGAEPRSADVHFQTLHRAEAVLVARKAHPATKRRGSGWLESLEHVGVTMARTATLPDLTAQAYRDAGVARTVVARVPTFTAAAAIVAESDLVATIPRALLARLARPLGLVALPGRHPEIRVPIAMQWHERTDADPIAQAFRAIVAESWPHPT